MADKLGYSIKEAASEAGCGVTKIYESLNDGSLRGRKLGRRTIILRDDLQAFLENLKSYR